MKLADRSAVQLDSIKCEHCGNESTAYSRFCNKCGHLLWDPCLVCEKENPFGERFCGHCGADAEGCVISARERLSQTLSVAENLAKQGNLLDAANALKEVPLVDHSQLQTLTDQVRERIDDYLEKRQQAIDKSKNAASEARELMQESRYLKAFERLKGVPKVFRNQEMRELYEKASLTVVEIHRLREEIRASIQEKKYDHLLSKVKRLSEIDKDDPSIGPLLDNLEKRQTQKDKEDAQKLAQFAKASLVKCDYKKAEAAARKLAEISPDRTDIHELVLAVKERTWLARQLKTEPYVSSTLRQIARRILKLQPHDQHHEEVSRQVETRWQLSRKEKKRISWAKMPKSSCFGMPVALLTLPDGLRAAHAVEHPTAQAMPVAYGLALQGLGHARVNLNLAPSAKKAPLLKRLSNAGNKNAGLTAWGIDIGSRFLKAVLLEKDKKGGVKVAQSIMLSFGNVVDREAEDDLERANIIAKFLSQYSLDGEVVALNMPGDQTLFRSFDLPAPKPKKFFEAVEFELRARIPKEAEQLEFDYHWEEIGRSDESKIKERRVVLIAVKKSHADVRLELLDDRKPAKVIIQCDGIALANATRHFLQESDTEDTVATLEIGSATSNLVIQSKNSIWLRTIYMGTDGFDKAVASALQKTKSEAEVLRIYPEKSRAMHQLHEILLPEFSKYAEEVQRSLDRFENENGEVVSKVVLCGSGSNQYGLLRYLQTGS